VTSSHAEGFRQHSFLLIGSIQKTLLQILLESRYFLSSPEAASMLESSRAFSGPAFVLRQIRISFDFIQRFALGNFFADAIQQNIVESIGFVEQLHRRRSIVRAR
jgi:hypothetical protein